MDTLRFVRYILVTLALVGVTSACAPSGARVLLSGSAPLNLARTYQQAPTLDPAATVAPATATALATAVAIPPATPAAPDPTESNAANPAATQSPAQAPTAKDVLISALKTAITKIKTYRVKVPSEYRLIDVVLPDRFHQTETWDTVYIGETFYRDGSKSQIASVPFFDKANLSWYAAQFAQAPQTTFLGQSTIDGVPAVGYLSSIPVAELAVATPVPNTGQPPSKAAPQVVLVTTQPPTKIWFSTATGFPIHIEYQQGDTTYIALFYDFNAKIEVTPPF